MEPTFTLECQNIWRFEPGKHDQEAYVLQAAEAPDGGKGRYKIINNPTRKNVNSFGTGSFNNLSGTKMPASINWANFTNYSQNSKSSNLEWKQFPMFDINRKIESIWGPVKRTSYGTMEVQTNGRKLRVGESSSSPHLIEFSSEEQQLQQQIVADTANEEMGTYESIRGSSPDLLSSKFVYKDHFANTNLSYLSHEMRNGSSHSTFMVSGMKYDNERFLRSIGSSWTGLKDGANSHPNDIPRAPLSGEVCGESKSSTHSSFMQGSKSIPGLIKSNEMENGCSVGTVRTEKISCSVSSGKEGSSEYANVNQLLFTKKTRTDLCLEDQMIGESAVSANAKGTSFFERLTLPSLFHHYGHQEENPLPLMGLINMKESDGLGINFMDKWNNRSVKIDTMCVDVPMASSSPEVGTSSKPQKDVACHNLNWHEIGGTDLELMHDRDMTTSRSENMDVDHFSCTGKPSSLMENKLRDSDATWKWVKRLRSNTSDSIPVATKRLKLYDVSSGVQNSQSQHLDNTNLLPKNRQNCYGNSVKEIPWVQRWCRLSQEMPPLPVLCAPENLNVVPENLEAKQFLSLAAMALMGKSVNNFRPCVFHRRGSTTVWNTEES